MTDPLDALELARLLYDIVNEDRHLSSKEIFSKLLIKLQMIFATEQYEKLLALLGRYKNSGESLTKIADEMYEVIFPKMTYNFNTPDFKDFNQFKDLKFPEPIVLSDDTVNQLFKVNYADYYLSDEPWYAPAGPKTCFTKHRFNSIARLLIN
jgi:hypothetical protein